MATFPPSSWITGWSSDGTDITLPIASFPELSAGEADATNGDFRKVLFAFCEQYYNTYLGKQPADKPTAVTISKGVNTNTLTGVITNTYTFTIKTSITGQEVVGE